MAATTQTPHSVHRHHGDLLTWNCGAGGASSTGHVACRCIRGSHQAFASSWRHFNITQKGFPKSASSRAAAHRNMPHSVCKKFAPCPVFALLQHLLRLLARCPYPNRRDSSLETASDSQVRFCNTGKVEMIAAARRLLSSEPLSGGRPKELIASWKLTDRVDGRKRSKLRTIQNSPTKYRVHDLRAPGRCRATGSQKCVPQKYPRNGCSVF